MTDARTKTLTKQLVKIAKEQGYTNPEFNIVAVPVDGSNFTSELFHATISSIAKDDLNVFAKVAVLGANPRKVIPYKIFDIEQFVYTKLLSSFKEIEDKNAVQQEHRLVTPKFYAHSGTYLEEVIVLEDLSKKGYTTHDRFSSLEWDYAASAVVELAKLHGLSIAYQIDYPEEYEEAKKVLKAEPLFGGENIDQMLEDVLQRSYILVKEEYRSRLKRLFDENYEHTRFVNFGTPKRAVIIHSDFKQANLMHKIDENGQLKVIIVDYQTLKPSTAASDLLYFTFNCADGQFREKYFYRLIDLYYQSITDVLKRLHLDPEEVYPRGDFDEELKETMPFALMNSVIVLPILYVEQSDVRQVEPDDGMEALTSMVKRPNALCAQRLNELVDDCVRWGVI